MLFHILPLPVIGPTAFVAVRAIFSLTVTLWYELILFVYPFKNFVVHNNPLLLFLRFIITGSAVYIRGFIKSFHNRPK